MRNTKTIGYLTAFVLMVQFNSPTFIIAATGMSILVGNKAYATEPLPESDTPLLDKLKTQYNINDPYRNHRDTDKIYKTLGKPIVEPTRTLNNLIVPSTEPTRNLNLPTSAVPNQDPSQLLQQYESEALAVGLSNATPTGDADGNLDVRYSRKGTRTFSRDADGNLVMGLVEDEPDYVEGITKEDVLSSEVNRTDYNFNADQGYGDNNLIINEGKNSKRDLSTGTNASSRAYQMVTSIANSGINTTIPDNAAFLAPSRSAFDDVQKPNGGFFSACSTSTEKRTQEINYPIYDEYNCQKNTAQNLNYCEVSRKLRIPIVVVGANITSCGVGCYELSLGSEGDNYWWPTGVTGDRGGSGIFSEAQAITFKLSQGMRLSAVRASATFDDHFEFTVNGALAFSQIEGRFSYVSNLPSIPPNASRDFGERGNDSMGMRNVSFGVLKYINQGADDTYNFQVNTLVSGAGEMLMKMQFQFIDETGEGFGEVVTQTPENCFTLAGGGTATTNSGGGDDGETGGSNADASTFTPSIEVPTFGAFQCSFDGYIPTEQGDRGFPQEFLDYLGPMYQGDTGNKTWSVTLDNYRCDPFGDENYCVANAETGDVECYTWDELLEKPNQCAVYEEDNSCTEVGRKCTDGWSIDIGGEELCYNDTVTFKCETPNTITRETEREVSACAGALPCIGGDCAFGETESNTRFVEAAVQANVLQQVDGDRFCSDEGDPSTCKIFTGEAEYCSWEVTGLGMDCCEAPGGMDILSYIMTANLMLKTNKMAADGLFGATAKSASTGTSNTLIELKRGAGDTIRDGVTDGWNALPEAITTPFETLAGNVQGAIMDATGQTVAEGGASAATNAISTALAELQQQAMELVYDMLPEELATALFTEKAGEKAGEEATKELVLNEAVSSALQSIMAAYSIYSTIKLALTLLTMCDENESDMGIKLGQRQCFKVNGDYCSKNVLGVCYQKRQNYCCYNSILARIVMEQAGPLLGKDLTTCEGLTQEELGRLDFKRIDLSEWVGLMVESGSIKNEGSERALTGAGELVGSRCETFEVEDPETGVVTVEERCFKELKGGREINTYGRQNVSDRTAERMSGAGSYAEDIQNNAREVANNLDCSATPRPPICNFGFDIRDDGSN